MTPASFGFARRLGNLVRRRTVRVVAAALLTAGVVTPLSAAPASAYIDPPGYTIFAPTGWADAEIGGWFDGLVYLRHEPAAWNVSNKWMWGTETYVGPGGQKYAQLRHMASNRCLSHTADLLFVEPCVWADNSQWWATEDYAIPCPGICNPVRWSVMKPWDQPTTVVTDEHNDILTLRPKVGASGSANQKVNVVHLPAPPW
jgi:hypothetical protein